MALFNVIVTVVTVTLFLAVLVAVHRRISRSTRYASVFPETPTSFTEMFTPPPPAAAVALPLVDVLKDGAGVIDRRYLDLSGRSELDETLELHTPPPSPPPHTPRPSLRPTKGIPPARFDVSLTSF